MTQLIALYTYFPVFTIVFLVILIVRLIIRATRKSNNNNNFNQYNTPFPPPPPPGQNQGNNPASNPYGQQNPPPPFGNPGAFPNQPPPPGNPYTPPTYNQPGVNPNPTNYNPGYSDSTRSTSIPGQQQYSTHIGQSQPPKSNTGLIVGILIGVLVIMGGIGWFIYAKVSAPVYHTTYCHLGYQNPTDQTFSIILDDWDTIKVEPYTSSDDLDYHCVEGNPDFHWVMTDSKGTVIMDTTGSISDLDDWYFERTDEGYGETPTIILNPSRSEFVFWTLWYGDAGDDYCEDTEFGDSTYWVDAYTVTDPVIYDNRNPNFSVELGEVKKYSPDDYADIFVHIDDFHILYHRIYNSAGDELDVFNDFRNSIIELYSAARDDAESDGYTSDEESRILRGLDNLIPPSINENTEATDFSRAVSFIQREEDFFKSADRRKYNAVIDSSEIIMDHQYVEPEKTPFREMKNYSYSVNLEGFFHDQPRRVVSYVEIRDEDGDMEFQGIE